MVPAATRLAPAADFISSITRSQLEHALDGQRRGLKVYESLKSLNGKAPAIPS